MKLKILLLLLIPVLITAFVIPVYAGHAQALISELKTDKNLYNEGDVIVISGHVNTIIGETPIIIRIIYEATYIHLAQIEVAQDGTFSETVIVEGPLWKESGEYIVRASYQDQIVETTFNYIIDNSTEDNSTEEIHCELSYPDMCVPEYFIDLNCDNILYKKFTVIKPDPHRFDGNNNGIGCE